MFQDLPDEIKNQIVRDEIRASRINQRINKNYQFDPFCELPISEKEFARNPISGFIFMTSPGAITQDFHIFQHVDGDYGYLRSISADEMDAEEFAITTGLKLEWPFNELEYNELEIDDIWYDLNITKELYKLRKQCKNVDFFAGQQLKRIYSLTGNTDLEEMMSYLKKILYLVYNYNLDKREIINFIVESDLGFDYQGKTYHQVAFDERLIKLIKLYEGILTKIGLKSL